MYNTLGIEGSGTRTIVSQRSYWIILRKGRFGQFREVAILLS